MKDINELEKYLPVGSVVSLKNVNLRVMITGYFGVEDDAVDSSADEEEVEVFDYMACPFPSGILASGRLILFNHEQIEKVFCLGLVDEEQKKFNKILNEDDMEVLSNE